MTEADIRSPEEVREEVLGLLRGVENFPEIDFYSEGPVVDPGIIIPTKRSSFNASRLIVANPNGIFEAGVHSRVSITGNGAINQLPMREEQIEVPADRYPDFLEFVRGKVKELAEKNRKKS